MNFLFFGLGSIGQRHLRNLIKIEKKSKIYAYRKKYSTPLLDHRNKVLKGNTKEAEQLMEWMVKIATGEME